MTLYKYLSADRSDFFDNCLVRFTPANGFNDVFDGNRLSIGSFPLR